VNLTRTLLTDRSRRIVVFLAVGLIVAGFVIFVDSVPVMLLGIALALLVGVVLKSLSELQSEIQRGAVEARRAQEAVRRSEKDREAAARETEQRLDRVEASVSRAGRQASRVQEDVSRQLAQFSDETRRALAAMSERIDDSRRRGRVHDEVEPGPLRELGLSDSLRGIAPIPDPEP
jgi:hypothetical protein